MDFSHKIFVFFLLAYTTNAYGQKPIIYLIPGQGSDSRIFSETNLGDEYEIRHIELWTPYENMSLETYARWLSVQIDTSTYFSLIGVSLGGMIATEMSTFLNPDKVIIISSAKNKQELPRRYTFQKWIPIYQIVPNRLAKKGAQILQPIVEPDRNNRKDIFVKMLKDKDPYFLDRTIAMIIMWDREKSPKGIIHIHGDNDHTIPYSNVAYDYLIKDGSHMMTLTRSAEINTLLVSILSDSQ
jgi:pimeloyl-ACP methyl ester carboxylesterase